MPDARLSVVLVTDEYETIEGVIDAFDAQTAKDAVEVVIVMPSAAAATVDESRLTGFAGFHIVKVDSILPMPPARAAGVRACTAPVIFIGETHSYPHPDFARVIIDAHEGPWDIVVPGLDNANPSGRRSWASFLLDYGYWLSGLPDSPVSSGPTWNASYKSEVLLELDAILDHALSSGDELPMALRERNRKFYFASGAKLGHTNLEKRGWLDERFLSGLVVGANRGGRWSRLRRLFYFAASPLIPFVLVYRNVDSMRHLYRQGKLPAGSAAVIATSAIVRSFGEAVGYARGISENEMRRMEEYELKKTSYVANVLRGDELV